jgi:LmbE family N-acetylglucosaminyl deacetylase
MILQNPDRIPLRRPHFHLRDRNLYFLISRRPTLELSDAEAAVWDAIDGVTPVSKLCGRFPDAGTFLEKLHESEALEFAEPLQTDSRRRKILIIEPHMDDAVLSVGGLMWKNRGTCEFTVATVAGRSNFTSYQKIGRDYFDVQTVTDLRCRESELAMRLLGGTHMVLDGLDAPLRYHPGNWTPEWFLKNRRALSAFQNHSATAEELSASTAHIGKLLRQTDASEIWIPLGVGCSADHETTRNACLIALVRAAADGLHFDVRMYQDVPYAMAFPRHTGQLLSALESAGAQTEQVIHDIGAEMPVKLRLISIFASQFKMSYMRPKVEATARLVGGKNSGFREFTVKLKRLPRDVDTFELYSGRKDVQCLRARLAGWYPKHRSSECITILCPMGVGRWKENMEALLERFPHATFEIHMTEDACEETHAMVSSRIKIRPVKNMAKGWMRRLLRSWFLPSRPMILFTGHRHSHAIPWLRICFAHAAPLPAATMDHLVTALRHMDESSIIAPSENFKK